MTPAAVIVAVALIAGAGYCFGREVGERQGRQRTLEQVRRLGHRRHPSERAAAAQPPGESRCVVPRVQSQEG